MPTGRQQSSSGYKKEGNEKYDLDEIIASYRKPHPTSTMPTIQPVHSYDDLLSSINNHKMSALEGEGHAKPGKLRRWFSKATLTEEEPSWYRRLSSIGANAEFNKRL